MCFLGWVLQYFCVCRVSLYGDLVTTVTAEETRVCTIAFFDLSLVWALGLDISLRTSAVSFRGDTLVTIRVRSFPGFVLADEVSG